MSGNMTPEVREILRNQDQQLKSLQLQIQKLLASQSSTQQPKTHSVQTQTTPTKLSVEVNTGHSLLERSQAESVSFS